MLRVVLLFNTEGIFLFISRKENLREMEDKITRRKKLDATMKKVATELVTKDIMNKTEYQIAEENGIDRVTIYRWKQRKDFNDYLQEIADEFQRAVLPDAYQTVTKLLNSKSEKVQLKAAELILKNQGRLKDVQEITATEEVNITAEEMFKNLGI